jgi:large subunit ribosomal protein L13
MKTYSARPSEIERKWLVIDAEGLVLGRLAVEVADILRGKNKPIFTPHMDCGDNVVIINAEKVKLTGKKYTNKIYYRHTGHPGGIKETTPRNILEGRFPERVITLAVTRMMGRGPLSRDVLSKLHVYKGARHPHEAQKPEAYDFGAINRKNRLVTNA